MIGSRAPRHQRADGVPERVGQLPQNASRRRLPVFGSDTQLSNQSWNPLRAMSYSNQVRD